MGEYQLLRDVQMARSESLTDSDTSCSEGEGDLSTLDGSM